MCINVRNILSGAEADVTQLYYTLKEKGPLECIKIVINPEF